MKNIKKIFIALFAVVLLAGCAIKEDYALKIQSDKKVNLEVKIQMDNEMIDALMSMNDLENVTIDSDTETDDTEYTDEDRWKYLDENIKDSNKNYKYEKIEEGNYKGYKVAIEPTDIDKITGEGDKINIAELEDLDKRSMFTKADDVYKSNLTYKLDEELSNNEYFSQIEMFKINFSVELPNKSISNNADTVSEDGLTLTWDLSKQSTKDIDFSFKFDSSSNNTVTNNKKENSVVDKTLTKQTGQLSIIMVGIIAAASLFGIGIIILIIVLIVKSSKKKKTKVVEEKKTE